MPCLPRKSEKIRAVSTTQSRSRMLGYTQTNFFWHLYRRFLCAETGLSEGPNAV